MLQKLEKFIFLALIFSIPFQKRTFLFGPAFEGERFFEWGSGFFYFTDFLVMALAILWACKLCRDMVVRSSAPELRDGATGQSLGCASIAPGLLRFLQSLAITRIKSSFGAGFFLFIFLSISFISLTQADLINVGVYRFLKLAEFIFLFFYTVAYAGRRMSRIRPILWTFIASGVFQSIIAILQFAKQSSLGLEIFHESTLAIHMKGVAHIASDGLFLIRAYGTFPSPNVLAGFLGLCLLFLFYLFIARCREKIGGQNYRNHIVVRSYRNVISVCATFSAMFLLTFGFLITFSRGTILFFVLVSALFFAGMFLLKQFEQYKIQAFKLLVLVSASWVLVIALAWPEFSSRFLGSSFDEPAIQERLFFNGVGLSTVERDPMHALFGVGIGNFVHNFIQSEPGLPEYLYQPVHNIFILIASETGTLGLFAFVLFIALLFEKLARFFSSANANSRSIQDACYSKHLVYYIWALVFCFLVLVSMYDHYFWTLQQGGMMFWITLGLIAGAIRKYN